MKFKTLEPMLHTLDLDATIAWYGTMLGFSCQNRMGTHWCHLVRDQVSIMFMHNAHFGAPNATATQYFNVDDVTALFESLKDKWPIEWGLEEMPYGMLEFAIKDNNGYLLSFGEDISDNH